MLVVLSSLHSMVTVSAMDANGCYKKGSLWDELGTWDDIERALDNDPIYNTGVLNEDSDTVSTQRDLESTSLIISHNLQVKANVQVGEHCFIFHITVAAGNTTGGHQFVTEMLRHIYDDCDRGGVQKVWQIENNTKTGHFWVRGDPQVNSDCS